MKAINLIGSIEEIEKMIHTKKVFMPNAKNHAVYVKYHNIFDRLYTELKPFFPEIVLLQQGG